MGNARGDPTHSLHLLRLSELLSEALVRAFDAFRALPADAAGERLRENIRKDPHKLTVNKKRPPGERHNAFSNGPVCLHTLGSLDVVVETMSTRLRDAPTPTRRDRWRPFRALSLCDRAAAYSQLGPCDLESPIKVESGEAIAQFAKTKPGTPPKVPSADYAMFEALTIGGKPPQDYVDRTAGSGRVGSMCRRRFRKQRPRR